MLDKFKRGDEIALAKVISFVENQQNGYRDVLAKLYPRSGNAYRIGVTGPSGVGKSTLVDRISLRLIEDERTLGIIAVDPSSPFTGGALLGDRIRMQNLPSGRGVFVRSMATRGSKGGLAIATKEVSLVLDAFGKDYVIIETVGVGQIELDVVDACDTTIVVLVPESGDSIQAMKAGLMEIADIIVVNKTDREGADRFILELESILEIKRKDTIWSIPVVPTQAIHDKGVNKLLGAVQEHRLFLGNDFLLQKKRKRQIQSELLNIIEEKVREHISLKTINAARLNRLTEDIFNRKVDPYSTAERLFRDFFLKARE